jgi:coenzyme F420-0:L-glutamate ligase
MPSRIELYAASWPEIGPGDDLARLVSALDDLCDGDVVVVTSKVVSKAEGRIAPTSREAAIANESRRVVARRGATVIAETHHGLVMAAAGVDASNTSPGTALTLPADPDQSARRLRDGVLARTGRNVAVIVSDTAGRAWRTGQTDLAIGCAGLLPMLDHSGTRDTHGNVLLVTAPAIADELAGTADLVKGKASGRPIAVIRGLADLVLRPGDHGPGAVTLVRPTADDLFGLGAREAVAAAVHRVDPDALEHFPARSALDHDPFEGLLEAWRQAHPEAGDEVDADLQRDDCPDRPGRPTWTLSVDVPDASSGAGVLAVGRLLERADTLAAAAHLDPHAHEPPPAAPGHLTTRVCWQDR